MSSFVIEGGHRMRCEITPQGAKNEALEVICATLLTSEKVEIRNVPDILDVANLIRLLADMGVKVEHVAKGAYTFQADAVDLNYLETDDFLRRAGSLRGSVMMTGPLLARFGRAVLPNVGGDKIGRRRLDTHILGFRKLGAEMIYHTARRTGELRAEKLRGTYMLLDEASLTGTANILMAAVMAAGMVPPLALSAATFLRARLFTKAEVENGRSAWLLGLSFITEGAIPFAAADPLRIIPPSMVGGAVTGALSMVMHVGSKAPHGGIFVFFAIDNFLGFLIAILAGAIVTCAGVLALKQMAANKKAAAGDVAEIAAPAAA